MPDRIALDRNVRERAAQLGRACGYPYAEAFVRLTSAAGADRAPVLGEAS